MSESSDDQPVVREETDPSRFVIEVDEDIAGFSEFRDLGEDRIFFHTVIDGAHEGRGLASILTQTALETSASEGHRIVAVCPYVKRWLERHHQVDDALVPVRPEHLEAIR